MKPHHTANDPHLNKRKRNSLLPVNTNDLVFVLIPICKRFKTGLIGLTSIIFETVGSSMNKRLAHQRQGNQFPLK